MVCRKSIQFCKTIFHRKRTKEKRKNKKEGKEGKEYYSLLFSLFSTSLLKRTLHSGSAHFTSKPNNQRTNRSQNVHNRRLLHSPSPPPPIPPPLHPLLPLLHHTNHDPHHLSHDHPKTTTKTKTKPHLGRNVPHNSMDNSPFADNSPMHEFD